MQGAQDRDLGLRRTTAAQGLASHLHHETNSEVECIAGNDLLENLRNCVPFSQNNIHRVLHEFSGASLPPNLLIWKRHFGTRVFLRLFIVWFGQQERSRNKCWKYFIPVYWRAIYSWILRLGHMNDVGFLFWHHLYELIFSERSAPWS